MLKCLPTTLTSKSSWIRISGAFVGSILFHIFILAISYSEPISSNIAKHTLQATIVMASMVPPEPVVQVIDKPVVSEPVNTNVVPSKKNQLDNKKDEPDISSDILTPAKIIKLAELDLPLSLLSSSGMVVIEMVISEKGMVESFSILHSSPDGLFDNYIQNALLKSEIRPAYVGNKPVRQNMILEIQISGGVLGIGR